MTNPISNAGILTPSPVTDRKAEARTDRDGSTGVSRPAAPDDNDSASVDRAQQRLTQETGRPQQSGPDTTGEARDLANALRQQISANPQDALRAMGLISDNLFEAATARPTA